MVRQGMLMRLGEVRLAEGTEVVVTPVGQEAGTAAAVLAAVKALPDVPAAWVDELEQLIAEGQSPSTRDDPFADAHGGGEGR